MSRSCGGWCGRIWKDENKNGKRLATRSPSKILLVSLWCLVISKCRAQSSLKNYAANIRNPIQVISSRFEDIGIVVNPFVSDDEEKTFVEIMPSLIGSVLTTLYGTTLILCPENCTGQLHCMTMFRATGQRKVEVMIQTAKRNFRKAQFAALRQAPSFLMAKRSIKRLDDRILYRRRIMVENKVALADGKITKREARKLYRMRKVEIQNIKRDMRRLTKAGLHLGRVIRVLNIDEITDIAQSFGFQLLAVLATGHGDSRIGSFVTNSCLLRNLGSFVCDANSKLGYPLLSSIVLSSKQSSSRLDGQVKRIQTIHLENANKLLTYGISTCLVLQQNSLALRLNEAFMSSAILMRGLRGIVKTIVAWDVHDSDGDGSSVWLSLKAFLEGVSGGVTIICLTAMSFHWWRLFDKFEVKMPSWILVTLEKIESTIKNLALVVDKAVYS